MIKLFSITLFLALGVFSIQAQACTESRSVTCVGHNGQAVGSNHCVSAIPSFHYSTYGSGEATLGQTPISSRFCSCPGGGWVDVDGDGITETRAEDAPPGEYATSDNMGGEVNYSHNADGSIATDSDGNRIGTSDGTTTISTNANGDGTFISGTHEDGPTISQYDADDPNN